MNNNTTEIVFILDRSGSMSHLTDDTIGGYNSFLENQKKEEGEALITTILFDDKYEVLHNGVNINNVELLTNKDYYARGMTALMDAIGKTINEVSERLNKFKDEYMPKVIFVITTDGQENCSREFNRKIIKDMITEKQDKFKWQFMFLGANIDAVEEAESIGISSINASNIIASSIGTEKLYNTVSNSVSMFRSEGELNVNWKDGLK